MKKITLSLTNHNRVELLIESFKNVLLDKRIEEVCISDDCSDEPVFKKLLLFLPVSSKIRIDRLQQNVGMSRNKKEAIEMSRSEWCILFDSDNIIKKDYLDALAKAKPFFRDTIYCPDFAAPEFDYRKFSGMTFSKENVRKYIDDPIFNMMLNTCNYFVNRENYLKVYRYDPTIRGSDTIHFNFLWLQSGGKFHVVPEMSYFHRVHTASGFLKDVSYNMQRAEQTRSMIRML